MAGECFTRRRLDESQLDLVELKCLCVLKLRWVLCLQSVASSKVQVLVGLGQVLLVFAGVTLDRRCSLQRRAWIYCQYSNAVLRYFVGMLFVGVNSYDVALRPNA